MPPTPTTPSPSGRLTQGLLLTVALLLGINLVAGGFGTATLPQAQAESTRTAPLNAAAQRKAIQQEIAGLRSEVQSLKQSLTSRPLDVRVVNTAPSSD
ncbi:MAG: hypothetical protein AAGI68_04300 [Planctomycetota bacterium]